MNKPRGLITTASDEKERGTVYDLLEPGSPWVGPVGRLDKASEGLLLLTNDSEWAAEITEPKTKLDKTYHVQVNCLANEELLTKITRQCAAICSAGMHSAGMSNFREAAAYANLRVKAARLLRHGKKNSWLEITLDEGKNRQIRRLLEALNIQVLRLIRVSIGPLQLHDLKRGSVRQLRVEEKKAIDLALRPSAQTPGGLPSMDL
jgi:23S rRNA pseudouridine2605 synthase